MDMNIEAVWYVLFRSLYAFFFLIYMFEIKNQSIDIFS